MTPPERRLWHVLKTRPDGFKFRRQHSFGPYTLDFFCFESGLAIEVDGFSHELGGNPRRDEIRDNWCAEQGIKTIRIAAVDVRDNLEAVVCFVIEQCKLRAPAYPLHRLRRSPSPANAGEEIPSDSSVPPA